MAADSIWIHYARPRPHWYGLAEDRQRSHVEQWRAANAVSVRDGAILVGKYHVRGQSDFETVEIWRFATPEAAFDHWARLTSAGYNEWFAFANHLGLAV